tara:strand:- start:42 stop:215 length:174 start_codon:yes stop_codon:yes gene_type:complete
MNDSKDRNVMLSAAILGYLRDWLKKRLQARKRMCQRPSGSFSPMIEAGTFRRGRYRD